MNQELIHIMPRMLRFARQRLHDHASAEDAVQESLIAILENPQRFLGQSSLSTYALGILKHKIIDHFRNIERRSFVDTYDLESGDLDTELNIDDDAVPSRYGVGESSLCKNSDPVNLLETKNFMLMLEHEVALLPARSAEIFSKCDCLEFDRQEICDALGISKNNFMVSLHRARQALRARPGLRAYSTA